MSDRDARILAFLRDLHGADPNPLRTYLEHTEVREMMSGRPYAIACASDLDVNGYVGKWCHAVGDSVRAALDPDTWTFWIAARKAFLELGGEYVAAREPARSGR